MPGLSSPGIGSGIDVNSLVQQLVAAERAPFERRVSRQESRLETQISALGTLKGALSGLQSALAPLRSEAAFQARKATTSDEKRLGAAASASAAPGRYDIEIVELASAHKLASTPFAGGPTSTVGTGTLTISVGSESFDVAIGAAGASLAGIRDAINAAPTNDLVRATLITTADGSRLVLTARSSGAAQRIQVSQSGGDGGLAALVHAPPGTSTMTELEPARDAHVRIEGFDRYAPGNTIEGAIDGVTLTLREAAPGTVLALDVAHDGASVSERVKKFVTAFNALAASTATLRRFDPATRAAGPLLGDALLRGVESQLRGIVSSPVAGASAPYDTLAGLGIVTNADGTLRVDEARLARALETDFDAVGRVFGSSGGIAARLASFLDGALATDAQLAVRTDGLQRSKQALQDERDAIDRRMAAIEARYRAQFSALDQLLAGLQSTSSYLAQQLANLPKP